MFALLRNMSSRIFIALLKKSERVICSLDAETRGGGGMWRGGDQRHVD